MMHKRRHGKRYSSKYRRRHVEQDNGLEKLLKKSAPCWSNLGRTLCHTGAGTLLNGQQSLADPGWRRVIVRGKKGISERKDISERVLVRGKKRAKTKSSSKKRASLHCPSPHQWYWWGLRVKHSENGGNGADGREMLG